MFVFKKRDEFKIFDNVFEPVIVINISGTILYFNHNFRIFSQLSPRALKKAKIQEIASSKELKITNFIEEGFELNEIVLSKEIDLNFKDNSRISVIKAEPIEVLGEKLLIIYFNDMSVEKKLYDKYKENIEELKAAYSQILQSDKMTTMGELTASISHEIVNPLSIAKGNLELLNSRLKSKKMSPEKKKESLQTGLKNVWESVMRINDVVNNMRSFLHTAEDRNEYCRLEDIIKKSMELVASFYNAGNVKLAIDIKRNDLVALVNRIKIEQVFVNLFKNAYDAIEQSGIEDGLVKIVVKINKKNDEINIDVIDNGPGILKKDQENIFTMFFTTKKIGDGTGLGLAICKRIVESHSGQLILHSSKKGNTVFRIKLPMIEASSYSHNEAYLKRVKHTDGKKILVVDNQVEILNIINKIFQDTGYVFIGSTNGFEALDFLDSIQVDLIITDIEMPEMDGVEFAKKVREKEINTPIYYLSSSENIDKFNVNKEELNLSGFIMKPFGKQQILEAIEHSLGK